MTPAALRALDQIPQDADPRAHRCASWMLRWPGVLLEDRGSNRGRVLDHLLNAYRSRWSIPASTDLPWCAILASMAWAISADPDLWGWDLDAVAPLATRRDWWRASPLGDWYGAVHQMEGVGRTRGLWVTRADLALKPPARVVGALLCRERSGSGSDRGQVRTGAQYAGHVDVCVARLPSGRLLAVGGNLSDAVQIVERDPRDARLRGAVLLPLS